MSNTHIGNIISGPGSVQVNGDYVQQGDPETGTVQWNSAHNPSCQQPPSDATQLLEKAEVLETEATTWKDKASWAATPLQATIFMATADRLKATADQLRKQAAQKEKEKEEKKEAAEEQTHIEGLGDLMDIDVDDEHNDDSVMISGPDEEGNTRGRREVTVNSALGIEMEKCITQ